MVIYLYIIRSICNGDLYVGICKDVARRVKEHNAGKNRYTKGLRPWTLAFTETFPSWETARKKEKYYKSGSGKEELKRKLVP